LYDSDESFKNAWDILCVAIDCSLGHITAQRAILLYPILFEALVCTGLTARGERIHDESNRKIDMFMKRFGDVVDYELLCELYGSFRNDAAHRLAIKQLSSEEMSAVWQGMAHIACELITAVLQGTWSWRPYINADKRNYLVSFCQSLRPTDKRDTCKKLSQTSGSS
jgi:hypothetical protein